jgi:hypothetical protein
LRNSIKERETSEENTLNFSLESALKRRSSMHGGLADQIELSNAKV